MISVSRTHTHTHSYAYMLCGVRAAVARNSLCRHVIRVPQSLFSLPTLSPMRRLVGAAAGWVMVPSAFLNIRNSPPHTSSNVRSAVKTSHMLFCPHSCLSLEFIVFIRSAAASSQHRLRDFLVTVVIHLMVPRSKSFVIILKMP
jgi:hypothetical protein